MLIQVAHSPDSDDAFMFYALSQGKIPTEGYKFTHILQDIETLNQAAFAGRYEISAVSIHAYASLTDRYALLDSGASMGEQYGPMVIARNPDTIENFKGKKIAIPGKLTSAYLALQMVLPDFEPIFMPFDRIMDALKAQVVDAGLIIHEGQLQYQQMGFHLVLDLGQWWHQKTGGLPLPLGGNVVRRDLGTKVMKDLARLQKASIQYGLDHREAALDYALRYARNLERDEADKFVGMYVNERTVDYGEDGRLAVNLFLNEAFEKGLISNKPTIEFIRSN